MRDGGCTASHWPGSRRNGGTDVAKGETALAKADFSDPKIPVCQNATGQLVKDFREVREQLTRQMTSSVRWIDTMANLYQAGARTFLELGPKGVLSKMVKPNLEGKTDYNAINVATYEAAKTLAI